MHPFKHLHTINKHRRKVRHICFKIGIGFQGMMHDLSKYSPTEFWSGAKYFLGTRSPTDKERSEIGYSKAWMHHKGRNKHHFEYWFDVSSITHCYEPVKMPINYLKEMFADRIAASKVYRGKEYTDDYPLQYLTKGGERVQSLMHKETYETLKSWLIMLKDKGEKETFKYIKSVKDY